MLTEPYNRVPTHQGGTNLSYQSAFVVDFEGYNVDQSAFPELINDYIAGGRYWQTKSFSNNKYAQMTSFGANADVKRSEERRVGKECRSRCVLHRVNVQVRNYIVI